jgi:hypothetical protein
VVAIPVTGAKARAAMFATVATTLAAGATIPATAPVTGCKVWPAAAATGVTTATGSRRVLVAAFVTGVVTALVTEARTVVPEDRAGAAPALEAAAAG